MPTQKIPLLSWTTLRASYNTKYNWLAGSLLARTPEVNLGNILSNTQTRTINGELKFEELYNKFRFLRAVNTNAPKSLPPPPGQSGQSGGDDKKTKKEKKQEKKNSGKDDGTVQKDQQQDQQQIAPGQQNPQDTTKTTGKKGKKKKEKKVKEKKDPNRPLPEIAKLPRFLLQLATSVKRVGIQYTEDFGTMLPGYMDSTQIFVQS